MVNAEQLKRMHIDPSLADVLNETFERWDIRTPNQQAAFIGQCAHESNNFRVIEENLNYRAATLLKLFPRTPKRAWGFTPEEAAAYEKQPRKIANRIYGNRMGNRDEKSDDGWRFRGSGYLQLTGHDNFYHFSKAIGEDLVMKPDLVRTPKYAALSAGWFWSTHGCNQLADAQNWIGLTRKINGGVIGLADRVVHTQLALDICSQSSTCTA